MQYVLSTQQTTSSKLILGANKIDFSIDFGQLKRTSSTKDASVGATPTTPPPLSARGVSGERNSTGSYSPSGSHSNGSSRSSIEVKCIARDELQPRWAPVRFTHIYTDLHI